MICDHIETIAANSFSNFHAKGLDYLCLQRSETLTVKAYFYDDAAAAVSPEVVCPHDHRYPFSTTILSGQSEHYRYAEPESAILRRHLPRYQRFDWSTPLNGGSGFKWNGEAALAARPIERYVAGDTYWCEADEIHTIAIRQPQTVLLLVQHADVVPTGAPTMTFVPGANREPPPLDGLYDRMTVDRARELLAIVDSLTTGNQP
ncbi:hypothetical protein [Sphingobium yanoikuyae]|uniref:hypothetical protein n=1 Tax=Sphingobium yanoikuyae TaxID=13690 RepID=UPI000846BAB9|nr:hypothetical protein [Sphingobium yanoikuyae]